MKIKLTTRKLIANNIVYFRHLNNLSQEQLAEKMKSGPVYISELENAKRNVTSDFIDKLTNSFKVEPHELLIEREQIYSKRVDRKK